MGDRIRTFVNGVAVADLVDAMDQSGFIGLQVHSAKEAGLEVRWRNIQLQELSGVVIGEQRGVPGAGGWKQVQDLEGFRRAIGRAYPAAGPRQQGVLPQHARSASSIRAENMQRERDKTPPNGEY